MFYRRNGIFPILFLIFCVLCFSFIVIVSVNKNKDFLGLIEKIGLKAQVGSYISDPQGLANTNTIFVDKNNPNCDDANTLTQARNPETPWCTPLPISYNSNLLPGDTIYIRGGDYTIYSNYKGVIYGKNKTKFRILKSGTAGNPITISGYPGENVILRAGTDKYETSFLIDKQQYINIHNLNFVGNVQVADGKLYSPLFLGISNSSNIRITSSTFRDFQGLDDIGYGKRFPSSSDHRAYGGYDFRETWGRVIGLTVVSNFDFSNNSLACSPDYDSIPLTRFEADGLLTERGYSQESYRNIKITNNRFYNCGHDNIYIRAGLGVEISNNYFRNHFHTATNVENCLRCIVSNNEILDYGIVPSEGPFHAGMEFGPNTKENLIYNNLIYFTKIHPELTGDGIQTYARAEGANYVGNFENNKIFNNLVYRGQASGLAMYDTVTTATGIVGNKVYNNIFYDVMNYSEYRSAPIRIAVYPLTFSSGKVPSVPNLYGNEFKNNIIVNSDPSKPAITMGRTPFSIAEFERAFSNSSSNISSLPIFVDLANFNFHPNPDGPQVNSGICLSEIVVDIEGNTRPSQGCDIGPYEISNTISTPPPEDPTPEPTPPPEDPTPTPDPENPTPIPTPYITPTPLPPGITPTPRITPRPNTPTNTNTTNTTYTRPNTYTPTYTPRTTNLTLSLGSSGSEVTLFQKALVDENLLKPEQVTGTYDKTTENAVKAFQDKYNILLPTDPDYGKVDPRTVVVYLMLSFWHLVR